MGTMSRPHPSHGGGADGIRPRRSRGDHAERTRAGTGTRTGTRTTRKMHGRREAGDPQQSPNKMTRARARAGTRTAWTRHSRREAGDPREIRTAARATGGRERRLENDETRKGELASDSPPLRAVPKCREYF